MMIKKRILQMLIIIKYYLVLLYVKLLFKKKKNIWLISERGDEARDNGYSFYKYIKTNHKEINVKYVITVNSIDREKIEKNDIVKYRSWKHILYYATAKVLISTHIEGASPEFHSFTKLDRYHLIKNKGIQVFLQHGITKDYIPLMRKEYNPSLNLFICGAKKEYEFLKEKLGYLPSEIKYTGFSRFDYLYGFKKKQILLMPTWRNYLYNADFDTFIDSEYYKIYQSLINNNELISLIEKNDFDIIFYPHYEVQKYLSSFTTTSDRIKIASFNDYDVQKLLIESELLITDYSSVFFDFSYMKKPIIYYQFDYEKYRRTQYSEGYFKYERDGFGSITKKEQELIKEIEYYISNNFKLKQKYQKRISDFFEYNDKKNSERIYKEIIKLLK